NVPDTLNHLLTFEFGLLGEHPLGLNLHHVGSAPVQLAERGRRDMLGSYVNPFALSFISFQADQQIYLPEPRPQIKSILTLLSTYDYTGCQLGIALTLASISVCRTSHEHGTWHLHNGRVSVLVFLFVLRVVASINCVKLDVSLESIIFILSVMLMNVRAGGVSRSRNINNPHLPYTDRETRRRSWANNVSCSRDLGLFQYSVQIVHFTTSDDPNQTPHQLNAYVEETVADKPPCSSESKALYLKCFLRLL
ncbi:hypothetical protein GN958_ATG21448, partial [Phytophthora infestans]